MTALSTNSSPVATARYNFRHFIDSVCSQSKLSSAQANTLTTALKSPDVPKYVLLGFYSEVEQIKHMIDKPLTGEAAQIEELLKKAAKEYLAQA